ncbi:EAL domain-containing protein [Rhodoferax sp.]|uniref:EAL domain-containing response regulator n=1 Tax=Rhodoferax sp. TaxID=50421 RepID=UPI00374DD031
MIDDDSFALKLLARQLALAGCDDVTLHQYAREALAHMESPAHDIGLVFCDLQMPDIDGVEFVRNLARIGYRGGLVLISGEGARILHTVQKLAQAHHIHILGAVSKPVSTEQLTQLLDRNVLHLKESHDVCGPVGKDFQPYTAHELEQAIAENQLVNFYQPKVDFATGAVVGAEALVRWKHPQAGLVYPDQFIPLAEEHQLIDLLTRKVLDASLRQARAWHDSGLTIQVAINISMDNLAALDFPDMVAQAIHDAGLAANDLMLEVTESRLMKDPRAPLDILTRLRLKRIGLSIDDFGTGHSSLAQLRDIPFDELKLDRGFVHGADKDAALVAIVEGTLSISNQLGIKSVAEGVEDLADWNFMRGRGCNVAQGYFIAKPMPGDELRAWSEKWQLRRDELTAPHRSSSISP